MFPVDLLARMAMAAAGRAGGEAAKAALSKRQDSQRSFARDLLAFHGRLGEYADAAEELAAEVDSIGSLPADRRAKALDHANSLSERMGDIVEKLIGTLWPKLRPDSADVAREIIGRGATKRSEHRGRVLDVMDPALADLARAEYQNEMGLIYWARRLNAIWFDAERLEVSTVLPDDDVEPLMRHVASGHERFSSGGRDCPEEGPLWALPGAFRRISLAGDDAEQIRLLSTLLRENAAAVRTLADQVAALLRERFEVGDLL